MSLTHAQAKKLTRCQLFITCIGLELKRYRTDREITMDDLSEHSHVTKSTISKMEHGWPKSNPCISTLYALSKSLGISVHRWLEDAEALTQDYRKENT